MGEDAKIVPGLASFLSRYLHLGSLCDKLDVTSIVSMAIFVALGRMFLQSCGAFMGDTLAGILNKFGPSAMAICVGSHFVLGKNKAAAPYSMQIDVMAWTVYLLFIVKIGVNLFKPLSIYLLPRKSKTEIKSSNEVPDLFNAVKNLYSAKEEPQIPIVYGLPTVYSTSLFSFFVFLVLQLALLLGTNAANGLFIGISIGIALIVIQSILQYNSTETLGEKKRSHNYV